MMAGQSGHEAVEMGCNDKQTQKLARDRLHGWDSQTRLENAVVDDSGDDDEQKQGT